MPLSRTFEVYQSPEIDPGTLASPASRIVWMLSSAAWTVAGLG